MTHLNGTAPTAAAIRAALDALFEPGQVVELRIPKVDGKKTRTDSGYFDDFDKLAQAAARYDGRADGIYITLNPVESALLARAENRVQDWASLTTSDDYTEQRRWLPIDCDPKVNGKKRPPGISSTDAEHEAALAKAQAIRDWLTLQGWPEPVDADSGNGGALLYAVDLPNDDASRDLVRRVLQALAKKFDDAQVDIDTSVFNAARIWKLYGTLAGKGDSTAQRPHRRAAILAVPAERTPVPPDLLRAVARAGSETSDTYNTTARSGTFDSVAWVEAWLDRHDIGYTKGEHGNKTKFVLDECVFDSDHKAPDAAIIVQPGGKIGYECFHNSCQSYGWSDVRRKKEPAYEHRNGNGRYNPSDEPPHPADDASEIEPAPVPIVALSSFPELPESAKIDEAIGADACGWLDDYIAYSRQWSPRSYDGFHEACGLWLLSTIAARRIMLSLGGEKFTNLYIALCARTSLWAKSTAAKIAIETIRAAGLTPLLAPDDATPQAFIKRLAEQLPPNWGDLSASAQDAERLRLAFAGQRGWFFEEFGEKLAAMMRDGNVMADYRGHFRRFDDCPTSYSYSTIGRGMTTVERPYLALLANLTPTDLAPFARKGSSLWGDGFFARYAFVTPPIGAERSRSRFPDGWRTIPPSLLQPIQVWHKSLGIPEVKIAECRDDKGKPKPGEYSLFVTPVTPQRCTLGNGVFDAFYRYHDALTDLVDAGDNTDLDGSYTRFADKALRIAMLLASFSNGGRIELPHWARAQAIAERWRRSLHHLVDQLGQSEDSPERILEDKIGRLFARYTTLTAREAGRFLHISTGEAERVLEQMLKGGAVLVDPGKRTKRYRSSVASVTVSQVSQGAQIRDTSAEAPRRGEEVSQKLDSSDTCDIVTVVTLPQGEPGASARDQEIAQAAWDLLGQEYVDSARRKAAFISCAELRQRVLDDIDQTVARWAVTQQQGNDGD